MVNIERKEGLARICKIEVDNITYETPLLLDFLDGKDSLKRFIKNIDFGKIPSVIERFPALYNSKFSVLKPVNDNIEVLTGFSALDPKDLAEILINIRVNNINKLIYIPAIATPKNALFLINLGVDILDNIIPIIKGYSGFYMLPTCEFKLDSMKELPCCCEVCSSYSVKDLINLDYAERSLALARHNTIMLESQIKLAKELIKEENLRNSLDGLSRLDPFNSVILRIYDESDATKKYYPRFKKSKVILFKDSYSRPEVKVFFERALEVYSPKTKALLILPCTATKPYLISKTHRKIREFVKISINEIIISSPLVVPRELELIYPAINYDVPVTGIWDEDEIRFVGTKLWQFIRKGNFEKIIAHVESGYKKVVEYASKIGGFDVIYTAEGGILSKQSLERLKREIEKYNDPNFDLRRNLIEHMIEYQFYIKIDLNDNYHEISGKYPELKVFVEKNGKKEMFLRIDTNYGMLDIYKEFAKILYNKKKFTVLIDEFDPKGTIFSKGVIKANENIKQNDLVVFFNSFLIGVGRALISGNEMNKKVDGFAIKVKRKWSIN